MKKIEISGNWKTIAGAVRALNRAIKKITGYTGEYFDPKWYANHANKYGEIFDGDEMGYINVCLDCGEGVYNYAYAAVPSYL